MKGSCLCGAVTFEVKGAAAGFSCCHCGQCRKQSGHVWASAYMEDGTIEIRGELRWYRSSEAASRGFCPTCGSFLFWKKDKYDTPSFSLGAIDGPTGVRLAKHIFTADKGDYYDIADCVPQL
ncbi:MAG: GFA family protein [Pseudomonadota bacterium]